MIPRSFFELLSLKNMSKLSFGGLLKRPPAELDDETLLTLPHLDRLQIGESDVTPAAINRLFKQYLSGDRNFE